MCKHRRSPDDDGGRPNNDAGTVPAQPADFTATLATFVAAVATAAADNAALATQPRPEPPPRRLRRVERETEGLPTPRLTGAPARVASFPPADRIGGPE